MSSLTDSSAWRALVEHSKSMPSVHMQTLFDADPQRAAKFRCEATGILLDYSKNRVTEETFNLLLALARSAGLEDWRARMFNADTINHTEARAVLHVALRNRSDSPLMLNGEDIMPAVRKVQAKMRDFSQAVRQGSWRGYNGKPIKDIVNIGIGGSDLGPRMVCEALKPYARADLRTHFVSNIDGDHIQDTLSLCEPSTTLFIVSSKSFSTQETLNNALAARAWFLGNGGSEIEIRKHFVAVTTNAKAATEFGIDSDSLFDMWDWVGGRFSLWSAIGLPIALSVGMEEFDALLAGAYAMDQHFCNAPLTDNLPVILGLLGVWYNNFLGFDTLAVLPYVQHLEHFPGYLQQGDMESNGKRIDRNGNEVDYQTGPIIWGSTGTNAQHAFFQLMHQGTKPIPADFILVRDSHSDLANQQRMLLANGLAQMEALMRGKTADTVAQELSEKGVSAEECERLSPYMVFEGNKPTNALLMDKLTPERLGALIALYEHKIFVQGIIWNINSFDQWGVEYGKQLAKNTLNALNGELEAAKGFSASTKSLIDALKSE